MVRKIDGHELSLTIDCAKQFFAESKLPGTLNLDHWMCEWESLITTGIGEIFVYERNGEVIGMLGGLFWPCSMTADLEALEGFWFVKPEHRKGMAAIKILKAFEDEAAKRGCKRVKMVHLWEVNPGNADNIYRRAGYSVLQVHYVKEL